MILRSSLLKQALLNPDLCWEMVHNGYELEKTAAMAFGTLAHYAILQPAVFEKKIALKEPRKGKEFDLNDKDQYLLLPNTYKKLIDLQRAFYRKKNFKELIKGTIEGEWFTNIDGQECVAHPDVVNGDILIDYKTLSNVKKNWAYVAADGGYDIQFAHYHKILEQNNIKIKKWYHIVQITSFPYTTVLYKYTKDYIQHSLQAHSEAMHAYKAIVDDEYPINIGSEQYVHLNNSNRNDEDDKTDDYFFNEAKRLWA